MGADFPPFVLAIVLNLTEERKKLLSVFVVPKYKKKKHGSDNSKNTPLCRTKGVKGTETNKQAIKINSRREGCHKVRRI